MQSTSSHAVKRFFMLEISFQKKDMDSMRPVQGRPGRGRASGRAEFYAYYKIFFQ